MKKIWAGILTLLYVSVMPHGLAAARVSQHRIAQARIPWNGSPYFLTTRGTKVSEILQDIGSNYGVPVIVSAQVQESFTGTIQDRMPDAVLQRFVQLFNLAPYYDGQVLYIYKNQEIKSQIITPRYLKLDKLIHYLTHDGYASQKFCSLRRVSHFNALEIFGVPMCIERVTELAKNLDEKILDQAKNQETVQAFPLHFASAVDNMYTYRNQKVHVPGLVDVLREMVQGRSLSMQSIPAPGSAQAGPAAMIGASGSIIPTFSADARQNAIVVRDKKVNMGLYAKLIEQLDQPPVQIEISMVIIDVDAANLDALGVNWAGSARLGNWASIGLNANVPAPVPGAAFSTVLRDTPSFMLRLNALQQKSKAKILSRPSIVTLNNIQAVLDHNITFYTKLQGEKFAKLESITTGSLLRVTPRLVSNHGNKQVMLSLNIQDGRQSGGQAGSQEVLPQVKNSEISTQATLQPGQSLLLGGFMQNESTQGEDRIPLLGDIPILGSLFRNKTDSTRSVVRLFLIKAEPHPDRIEVHNL